MIRKILILLPIVFIFGCCPINQAFVKSVDDAWTVIGEEYVQYVENDESLDGNSKRIRKRTAKLLTDTIKEARK